MVSREDDIDRLVRRAHEYRSAKDDIGEVVEDLDDIGKLRHAFSAIEELDVDVSYAAPQAHEIVNVALHREYSPGIVFIFSQGRKDLYHV
jgi:hypothetical protein